MKVWYVRTRASEATRESRTRTPVGLQTTHRRTEPARGPLPPRQPHSWGRTHGPQLLVTGGVCHYLLLLPQQLLLCLTAAAATHTTAARTSTSRCGRSQCGVAGCSCCSAAAATTATLLPCCLRSDIGAGGSCVLNVCCVLLNVCCVLLNVCSFWQLCRFDRWVSLRVAGAALLL